TRRSGDRTVFRTSSRPVVENLREQVRNAPERRLPAHAGMKKAIVLALFAVALACSDPSPPPSPAPTPTPSPAPTPGPRVVLSGRVYAAAAGGPDHYPVGTPISARVLIVEGVNAGRETSS